MNYKNIIIITALSASMGTALSADNESDTRICMQPFSGELMRVSCENIDAILKSNPNKPLRPIATIDTADGKQINQINDKYGVPILFIVTPPQKKKVTL